MLNLPHEAWRLGLAAFALLLAVFASGHVLLHKRDSRAATAWLGFVWLAPLVGALCYFIFGVNRLRHQAASLRSNLERYRAQGTGPVCPPEDLPIQLSGLPRHLDRLARLVGDVVDRPLLAGNQIEPLLNGDEAYPAMLEAIAQARHTVSFTTYIFDRDEIGLAFARALAAAVRRGVEVRVLIDAMGLRYSLPTIQRTLRQAGVKHALFLPSLALWHLMSLNLRTHRKILVTDGSLGFTGGMNIRISHRLRSHSRNPVQDIQFRITGPVVSQLQEVFADDWLFATGEPLRGEAWFPKLEATGQVVARGVTDGPDENFEKLHWTLLGAISIASHSIRIVTPYFVPDGAVISALSLAAMRGVQVDIVLPSRSNLPFVGWASRRMWRQILERGCRIWLTSPPFDHSKLMLVDRAWVLFGSANWDARSLRLNFEFNVECYDLGLARRVEALISRKMQAAHPVSLLEIDGDPLVIRLRDGLAGLLAPYL